MDFLKMLLIPILSVVVLFIIAKIMGHKQLAQLDFFDYINGITIGSIAAELAIELEEPIKPLIALAVYGAVSFLLSLISHKFPRTRKYINGTPCILMNDGKLFRENMKQAKLDLSEFMVMCREQGYFNISDIHTAILETNGKLSVLPLSAKRPATPEDIQLDTKPAHIMTEIIMDGRIMGDNLKRMGLDEIWLTKKLKEQGYNDVREIFLGLCDDDHKLTLFPCN